MNITALVIMAAGIGSRFGKGIKQLAPVGPNGEIIMDYSIHDALEAGFNKVVFIIRKDIEEEFRSVIGNKIEKITEVEYAFQALEDLPELRNGWTEPRIKVLFSQRDLKELDYDGKDYYETARTRDGISRVYRDPRLGRLVWGELLPEMEDVRTVWFAPSGMLYQLGAEYLAIDSVTTMSDRYELHRLSSTRLITERKAGKQKIQSATVFGGLNYDMALNELQEVHERFKEYIFEEATDLYAERAMLADELTIDSLASRGSVNYLPGTRYEAEFIGEQLMQADIPTNLFMNEEGTEEAFKALDGRHQNLIHIATHGFYFTEEQVAASNAGFLDRKSVV